MRAAPLCLLVTACGGDTNTTPAVDASLCLVEADYGDAGSKTGTTTLGPTTISVTLDAGPPRDSFFIRLNAGKGVFAGGLTTGTFDIAGAELATDTCGLCVNLLADISMTTGPTKFYFANGGTVTLTSHTPPAGSIANVTLHETTSGGTKIEGGCTTSFGSMTFATQ